MRERAGRLLPGWTVRIVGLAGLAGLTVTLAAFAVAGPAFAEMRQGELQAHEMEDSYAPDTAPLGHVLLGGLPFLLLLLCLGCAALQIVHSSAVESPARRHMLIEGELRTALRSRLPRVLTVYVLRGLSVWTVLVGGFLVSEALTTTAFGAPTPLRPDGGPWIFVRYTAPGSAVLAALVLRLGWTLAPAAAAADGLAPFAALRRSWALVWSRAGWLRTGAETLLRGLFTVGVYVAAQYAAQPLGSAARSLVLTYGTDNPYTAHAAAALTPVALAALLSAALTLPPAHRGFALRYRRLRPASGRSQMTDRERSGVGEDGPSL
ncbi:hypothetical protein ACWET9_14885 [Streptomyces sp. NPDC004059]